MNTYVFSDIKVGMEESFEIEMTKEMLKSFCNITGDVNPLHNDEQFAKAEGFRDRVSYGMLTASFISTLGGVYLPGKYCLIQSVECKFINPVFIGDKLVVKGTVIDLHESVQQIEIKVLISNQKGEKILRGKLKAGFLNG